MDARGAIEDGPDDSQHDVFDDAGFDLDDIDEDTQSIAATTPGTKKVLDRASKLNDLSIGPPLNHKVFIRPTSAGKVSNGFQFTKIPTQPINLYGNRARKQAPSEHSTQDPPETVNDARIADSLAPAEEVTTNETEQQEPINVVKDTPQKPVDDVTSSKFDTNDDPGKAEAPDTITNRVNGISRQNSPQVESAQLVPEQVSHKALHKRHQSIAQGSNVSLPPQESDGRVDSSKKERKRRRLNHQARPSSHSETATSNTIDNENFINIFAVSPTAADVNERTFTNKSPTDSKELSETALVAHGGMLTAEPIEHAPHRQVRSTHFEKSNRVGAKPSSAPHGPQHTRITKITKDNHNQRQRSNQNGMGPPLPSTPRSEEVLRILLWTLQQEQQSSAQIAALRNDQLECNVTALKDAAVVDHCRLESYSKENAVLSEQLREANCRLEVSNTKFLKLARTVNGFQSNMDTLHEHGSTLRNACKQLNLELNMQNDEHSRLQGFFQDCVSTSTNLKDCVTTACKEARANVLDTEQANAALQRQLDAKQRTLNEHVAKTEELESQLVKTESAHAEVKRQLDQHISHLVERMNSLLETMAALKGDQETKTILGNLEVAVKDLGGRDVASTTTVDKLEAAMQALSERMVAHLQTRAGNESVDTAMAQAIEAQLKQHFDDVRSDLRCSHEVEEKLTKLNTDRTLLEERCSARDTTIIELQAQITQSREEQASLIQRLAVSEAAVSHLTSSITSHNDSSIRLQEMQRMNIEVKEQLLTAHGEVQIERNRVSALESTESALRDELAKLHEQYNRAQEDLNNHLQAAAPPTPDLDSRVEQQCAQTIRDANRFHNEKTAEFENKLQYEKQRRFMAEESLQAMQEELKQLKTRLNEQQEQHETAEASCEACIASDTTVKKLTDQISAKDSELQRTIHDHQKSEQERVSRCQIEIAELIERLEAENASKKLLELNCQQLEKDLEVRLREEQDKAKQRIDQLQGRIKELAAKESTALERQQSAKKDAEQALQATTERYESEIADLQQRLRDTKARESNVEAQRNERAGHSRAETVVLETQLYANRDAAEQAQTGAETTQDKNPTKKAQYINVPLFQNGDREQSEATLGHSQTGTVNGSKHDEALVIGDSGEGAQSPLNVASFFIDDISSSPLSEVLSPICPNTAKENQGPHVLQRGYVPRHGHRILRELTVHATTPVQLITTPPHLSNSEADSGSSLGVSKPLTDPFFQVFESPSANECPAVDRSAQILPRPRSNIASKMSLAPIQRIMSSKQTAVTVPTHARLARAFGGQVIPQTRPFAPRVKQAAHIQRDSNGCLVESVDQDFSLQYTRTSTPEFVGCGSTSKQTLLAYKARYSPTYHEPNNEDYAHHSTSKIGSATRSNKLLPSQRHISLSESQETPLREHKRSMPVDFAHSNVDPVTHNQRGNKKSFAGTQRLDKPPSPLDLSQTVGEDSNEQTMIDLLPEPESQLCPSRLVSVVASQTSNQIHQSPKVKQRPRRSLRTTSRNTSQKGVSIPTFKEQRSQSQRKALGSMAASSRAKIGSSEGRLSSPRSTTKHKTKRGSRSSHYSARFALDG